MKIAELIAAYCLFPVDFTSDDIAKFGNEVASEARNYLPEVDDIDELIDEVTATKKQVTVKHGKTVTKAAKGSSIQYTFRLHTWLSVMAGLKIAKVTGFNGFQIDLTSRETFWSSWKRAPVVETKP